MPPANGACATKLSRISLLPACARARPAALEPCVCPPCRVVFVCSVAAWTPSPPPALLKRLYSRPCATIVWPSGSSARRRL